MKYNDEVNNNKKTHTKLKYRQRLKTENQKCRVMGWSCLAVTVWVQCCDVFGINLCNF